jgi:hypothetical protein
MIWLRALASSEQRKRWSSTSQLLPLKLMNCSRIQDADISLCVLSLPEVVKSTANGYRLDLPPELHPFISANTLVLLNKSDLVPGSAAANLNVTIGEQAWAASLSTGEGMTEFMEGFVRMLLKRYGCSLVSAKKAFDMTLWAAQHLDMVCRTTLPMRRRSPTRDTACISNRPCAS